jgi:hypothetical protein
MTNEEVERVFSSIRESDDICNALIQWVQDECNKLENPKRWNRNDFEIDGKSNLQTAEKLRALIAKFTKRDILIKKNEYI